MGPQGTSDFGPGHVIIRTEWWQNYRKWDSVTGRRRGGKRGVLNIN